MDRVEVAVAIVGGGVVGAAVAQALAARDVPAALLEAEPGLALGASGTNSGLLHTGFDSPAGELETRLLLRAAGLRPALLDELHVPVLVCGARLQPHGDGERAAVAELARNARVNGVEVQLGAGGALRVPGEAVTDPVAFVHALAASAQARGATVRTGCRVEAIERAGGGGLALALAGGERVRARAVVNCAGLFADEVARMAGDELLEVYPRKGEFLVFDPPPGRPLTEILLPVPSQLGKGVLVFPTLDGQIVAGPTARERTDKHDWSVEPDAAELILEKAARAYPPLADCTRAGGYAGLRPAGRGVNYVIERSQALAGVVHVAAIRSTGLSAAPAIGEHVAGMLERAGLVRLGEPARAPAQRDEPAGAGGHDGHWWERAARHRAVSGAGAGPAGGAAGAG